MALRLARPAGLTAALPARRVAARAAAPRASAEATFAKAATAAAAATTLLSAGNALAAQSVVADVAASGDGRGAILASLAFPALGWVAFNMAEPTKNQLDAMAAKNGGKVARGLAASVGLAAAMAVAASSADAATSVGDLAASDNRLGIILSLFLPALGWVAFNMLGPVLNQLNAMSEKKSGGASKGGSRKRRSVTGAGIGLTAAALLGASSADAAEVVGDLAASDNRLGIILTLFVPALGWVLFNMAGPFTNQLNAMSEKNATAASGGRRARARAAFCAGLGLSALLGASSSADAAQLVGDLAASDSRLGIILSLFLPALGWVAFNMLGPFLNQLNAMSEKKTGASKGGSKRR